MFWKKDILKFAFKVLVNEVHKEVHFLVNISEETAVANIGEYFCKYRRVAHFLYFSVTLARSYMVFLVRNFIGKYKFINFQLDFTII